MFKRVALTGSAELFRDTGRIPDLLAETEPPPPIPAPIHQLPITRLGINYYDYKLTEAQVNALVDALQKVKYPHTLKAARPSMEEFEHLESLRQLLLEGIR